MKTTSDREEVPLLMAGANDGERSDAHVLSRSMLVIDVDCKPDKKKEETPQAWGSRSGKIKASFLRAIEFLRGPEGFDHAWHTTHSHTGTDRLGWRVWIPLAEDVLADQFVYWRDANHAVNFKIFNLIADDKCYNPERLMRLPAVHPDRAEVFESGYRCDERFLSFATLVEWYKLLPAEHRNKTRGEKWREAPRIYSPATSSAAGNFALPVELVNKLRLQCAQVAQGNQRLKPETRAALQSIAMCESLRPGERDNGLIGLVGFFSYRFLEIEPRTLLDSLLLPVLEKTHADDPDDPIKPSMPDPRDLCNWAIQQVEGRRRDAENPLGHVKVSDSEKFYIRDWTHGQRSAGMSEEEFRILATQRGLDHEIFKRRLFIMYGKDTFIWQVNRYSPRPMHMREVTLEVAQAVLAGVGISRRVFDENKSEFKTLALKDIIARHGIAADGMRASYLEQNSRFDERSHFFIEAMAPRRALSATHHDVIHEWLLTLGGEKLVDWVSFVPDLTRALSILFLIMPKNSGKNLLAHGLSRLWERGSPVPAENVFNDFSGELAESPFVFADEELPKVRGKSLGAVLRNFVSEPDVMIRRMYIPPVKCEGYVRMLIAANSDSPLRGFASGNQPTDADLSAIAERLLTIECDTKAVDYLMRFGPEEVATWRTKNKVAEHALWLAENWKVKEQGRRFAVEGNSEKALYKLVVNDELTSQVLDWFVTYALAPNKKSTSTVRNGLFARDGELYVSLSVITGSWSDFRPAYRMGSAEPFVAALEAVCHPGRHAVKRGAGTANEDTRQYWRVKFDYLEFYARRLGQGSEAVRRAIMEREDDAAQFLAESPEVDNVRPFAAPAKTEQPKRRAHAAEEI